MKGPGIGTVMAAANRDIAHIEELLRLGIQIEEEAWDVVKKCLALAWFDGYGQAREDLAPTVESPAITEQDL